ncbi:MAG: hypothetical protein ACYCUF_13200, partial [Acidimicrobiales bacterium]
YQERASTVPSSAMPHLHGHLDARAFFDSAERKWRIAARYVPAEDEAPALTDRCQNCRYVGR